MTPVSVSFQRQFPAAILTWNGPSVPIGGGAGLSDVVGV